MVLRRGCYRCGQVGHVANACPEADRLCYNCKQPGHEASACAEPRVERPKTCFSCGGVGHIQAECPNEQQHQYPHQLQQNYRQQNLNRQNTQLSQHQLSNQNNNGNNQQESGPQAMQQRRRNGPQCYHCGKFGHVSRICYSNRYNGRGYGYGSYPAVGKPVVTCYRCRGPNHFARDCQANAVRCYNCNKIGHISRDCQNAAVERPVRSCYRCGERGHVSRECPQQPPQDHQQQPERQPQPVGVMA